MQFFIDETIIPHNHTGYVFFYKKNKVVKFLGEDIPGFCVNTKKVYYKKTAKNLNPYIKGYSLVLEYDVKIVCFSSNLRELWASQFNNWNDVARYFKCPVKIAKIIVRHEFKTAARQLDFQAAKKKAKEMIDSTVIAINSTGRMKI